jgi:hypothetical protein
MLGAKTVTVGALVWMVDDLAVTVDRDGRPIELAESNEAWEAAFQAGRAAFRRAANPAVGLRYNQYALSAVEHSGWRVPTAADWDTLDAAAAKDPSIVVTLGFDKRTRSGEDGAETSYWMSGTDSNESWGASMNALPVVRFSWITMWGAVCDYGQFIRLVRDA